MACINIIVSDSHYNSADMKISVEGQKILYRHIKQLRIKMFTASKQIVYFKNVKTTLAAFIWLFLTHFNTEQINSLFVL